MLSRLYPSFPTVLLHKLWFMACGSQAFDTAEAEIQAERLYWKHGWLLWEDWRCSALHRSSSKGAGELADYRDEPQTPALMSCKPMSHGALCQNVKLDERPVTSSLPSPPCWEGTSNSLGFLLNPGANCAVGPLTGHRLQRAQHFCTFTVATNLHNVGDPLLSRMIQQRLVTETWWLGGRKVVSLLHRLVMLLFSCCVNMYNTTAH